MALLPEMPQGMGDSDRRAARYAYLDDGGAKPLLQERDTTTRIVRAPHSAPTAAGGRDSGNGAVLLRQEMSDLSPQSGPKRTLVISVIRIL